jgi:hypothetical protein
MASDGKHLESLVAWVEQTLTPQGLTVVTNERVFEEGIQIAEFDVTATGKFGSTEIRWLIECRDRPGHGAAPVSWIEQLVGRRGRCGFNKVTAVSTTGFAPSAIRYAEREGIELREVASLSPEAFMPWCAMRTIQKNDRFANLIHASLIIDDSEPEDKQRALDSLRQSTPPDGVTLRSVKTGNRGKLAEAFVSAVDTLGNLFDDVTLDVSAKPITLTVNYINDDDHFVVDTAAGAVRVRSITFVGELQIKSTTIPLTALTEYRQLDSQSSISEAVSFAPLEIAGSKLSFELHRLTETGEVHLRLHKLPD